VFSFVILFVVFVGRAINPLLGALLLAASVGYAVFEALTGSRALDRINKSHQGLTAAMAVPAGFPPAPPGFG
jgi:hypothetical protein